MQSRLGRTWLEPTCPPYSPCEHGRDKLSLPPARKTPLVGAALSVQLLLVKCVWHSYSPNPHPNSDFLKAININLHKLALTRMSSASIPSTSNCLAYSIETNAR